MLDILAAQISGIVAVRPPGLPAGLPVEPRRLPEGDSPKPAAAKPAVAEDQVLLGGAGSLPPAPLPLKPNEPVGTQIKLSDASRRTRPVRRDSPAGRQCAYQEPAEENPVGRTFDLRV
jgi:hypothetical protein